MGNIVRKTFTDNTTWTTPAGVAKVTVTATLTKTPLSLRVPSFFLDSMGNIYGCGANGNGQVGDNSVSQRTSPTIALGGLLFTQMISTSGLSTFGLTRNGLAYAWGQNTNGQLGLNDVVPRSSPVAVVGTLSFTQLFCTAAVNASIYGLAQSGQLYAWGVQAQGQLGVNDVTPRSSPTAVVGGLAFKSVVPSPGTSFGLVAALTATGAAYCWGDNTNGQCGDATVTQRSSPVAVVGGLTFSSIVVGGTNGGGHPCVLGLTTAGVAYGWGINTRGQLGVGDANPRSSPVAVVGGLAFASLSASPNGTILGVTTTGVGYAWGFNDGGQLGVGDVNSRSSPVAILGGLTFSKLYAGSNFCCGLTTAGALYAWGVNTKGPLGDGTTTTRSSPVLVVGGLTWSDLIVDETAGNKVWAYTTTGKLYAWGDNTSGALGNGGTTAMSSPVAVLGDLLGGFVGETQVTQLSVVPGTSYALNFKGQGSISYLGTNPIAVGNVASVTLEYQ